MIDGQSLLIIVLKVAKTVVDYVVYKIHPWYYQAFLSITVAYDDFALKSHEQERKRVSQRGCVSFFQGVLIWLMLSLFGPLTTAAQEDRA